MANLPMTVAGIDIGANTFRMLIARVSEGGMEPFVKKIKTIGLGRGLVRENRISRESMDRGLKTLASFRQILDNHKPDAGRACGTEALRSADNSSEFLEKAVQVLGIEIEVIGGQDEALLSLSGVLSRMTDREGQPMLLVDVGGGSTEFIYYQDREKKPNIRSLPIGAVGLTESFFYQPLPASTEVDSLTGYIRKTLAPVSRMLHRDHLRDLSTAFPEIVAAGGTATSLAALDLGLETYKGFLVQGHVLTESSLERIINEISLLSPGERNFLPGLDKGRGDIILAGAMIYKVLLEMNDVHHITVSDAGLLEGIVYSAFKN
ncbi:MAG: hypothetical protein U9O82_08655 [Thermodesulfobacteriota bacterium]|nr:hypothetical protein [Thermodesulfobacteriota bacterium]